MHFAVCYKLNYISCVYAYLELCTHAKHDQEEVDHMKEELRWVFNTQLQSIVTWAIVSVTFFVGMIELMPEIGANQSIYLNTLLSFIYIMLLFVGVFSAYRVVFLVGSRMRMEEQRLPKNMRMTIWGGHSRPIRWVFRLSDTGSFRGVNWPLVVTILSFWSIIWILTLLFKCIGC